MKRETAEKARELLNEIDSLKNIQQVLDTERDNWWALATPACSRIGYTENSSTMFTKRLRNNFRLLVASNILKCEEELENLKDE